MQTMQQMLVDAISGWYEAKPGRNGRMLARLASVSYSSVRRAESGDVEQKSDIVVPIAGVVMNPGQLGEFIRAFYPGLEKAVARADYPANQADDVMEFLLSEDHARIIMLASDPSGTSEEEVIQHYGRHALPYFQDILTAKILAERDGCWFFDRDIGGLSIPAGRKLLVSVAKACSQENDSISKASYALAGWEAVTPVAATKAYQIMEDAASKVCELLSDKNNRGEVLIAFGFLHNVIKGVERLK